MLESKDDDRGVNEASLFLGLGFKKTMGTFKLLFSYMTEELTVIRPQETGKWQKGLLPFSWSEVKRSGPTTSDIQHLSSDKHQILGWLAIESSF